MRPRDSALAVLVALIWGTNFVAIRTGLDSMPPLLFLAVRFVVVCVPAVFLVRRPGLPWRDLALIGVLTSLGQLALM
jgi:O-acetylserine/cysteine efflux transporter